MDDPRLHDRKQPRHHPEKDLHPFLKVTIPAAVVLRPEERRDRQDRGRKTPYQQHDIMIAEKAGLIGVMRGKQPPLIFEKLIDEPGAARISLVAIPGGRDKEGHNEKKKGIPPVEKE